VGKFMTLSQYEKKLEWLYGLPSWVPRWAWKAWAYWLSIRLILSGYDLNDPLVEQVRQQVQSLIMDPLTRENEQLRELLRMLKIR